MSDPFPGYDVLAKRDTPSWNAITRRVVDERLATGERTDVLTDRQRRTLRAVVDRVVPQPDGRPPVNAAALVLEKIAEGAGDGFRHHALPPLAEAWARGLDAIDAEAHARHDAPFALLDGARADAVLGAVERGDVSAPAWEGLPPTVFWQWRLIPDVVSAYYAHPSAWSAIGFGGPASPRGYVRLEADERDPWEAAEQNDGAALSAARRNAHVV